MSKKETAKSQTSDTPKVKYHFGRPSKYKRKYCQMLIEYFDIQPYYERKETITNQKTKQKYTKYRQIAHDLPTLAGFSKLIGVNRDTLLEWENAKDEAGKLKYPDFSGAIKMAKEIQEYIWTINTMKGLYNVPFSIFFGKNVLNWKDKSELTGKDDQPLTIQTIDYSKTETKPCK